MDENQTTTEEYQYDIPGVETEAATETPTETPVETPSYVTKDDLAVFARELASELKAPVKTEPTVNTDELYTQVAEQFYDNPAEAFKRIADHTRESVMKELAPAMQALYGDLNTRTVSTGLQPLEAEYVQKLASEGVIDAKAMQNPAVKDVVLRAAKSYAQEKAPTRAPSAEGTVGAPANFGGIDPSAKAAFENAFGMKIETAIKKAGLQ
jgi:hypothetical protein